MCCKCKFLVLPSVLSAPSAISERQKIVHGEASLPALDPFGNEDGAQGEAFAGVGSVRDLDVVDGGFVTDGMSARCGVDAKRMNDKLLFAGRLVVHPRFLFRQIFHDAFGDRDSGSAGCVPFLSMMS